ncbi:MAG: ATP-binding protein [Oscillospiraceae bacterium]|nr:ATP-binding protein [Oscillospiraceae bacterium]
MDDDYIGKMQTKENLCLANLQKAEEEYERNGKHTKEECVYLQRAANLRYEMARMSVGEERLYQQRKLREINERIFKIIKILDPKLAEQMAQKKAPAKAEPKKTAGSPVSNPVTAGENSDDVAGWFKEAPRHSFEDVSGMSDLKEHLKECITDTHLQELKDYLKLKKLHSFFFIGPPGCGKTYIIEAFAHELMDQNYKYLSLVGSDILSRYVGEAEKIVTRLFEEAEKNAPCIVFIDEVDGVCKNRSLPNLPEYAASITTAFLTGYNRINASDKPIIFIGATNYPNQVDDAMLDRVELIRVPFPDRDARESAFQRQLGKLITLSEDLSFGYMAEMTESYNYRDIDRLCTRLKNDLLKDVLREYGNEKDALWALKSGEYTVSRALFDKAKAACIATPKDEIQKELDEWEERFKMGAASQG